MRGFIATSAFIVLTAGAAHAQVTLQNDSFVDGDTIAAHDGFVSGEIAASRFVAPEAGRTLQRVQLIFAGAATTHTVTLHVWDDSAGTNNPGAELFSGDFEITGSDTAFSEFTLTKTVVTQQFRVGIEVHHDHAPSAVNDTDGTNTSGRNFLMAQGVGWLPSSTFGVQGDWVIRAVINGEAPPMPDAAPGSGTPDAAPSTGGECDGNPDCPVGEYCNTVAGTCTFDCREDSDCGDNTCNSLGQCVEGGGGGGGGCSTDGGGGSAGQAMILLALGVLVLGIRRRA